MKINFNIKKASVNFLYRCVVCLCIYGICFVIQKLAPGIWDKCKAFLCHNADISSLKKSLLKIMSNILPL